uniref:C2H2-type domain-containing protein n=1 Tax=Knipowitschia caucasica TaxID=637954 RepID=A0AAV2LA04_KNICA
MDFPEQNDFNDESNQFPENVSMDNYTDNNCVEEEEDEDDRDFYQCSFCGNRYNSIGALRNHMRRHILSRSIPPSSNPSKQIKDEDSSDVVICSLCGETFSNDQDLASHQVLHSTDHTHDLELSDNKEAKNLICGRCGVLCTSYNHLESHACEVVDVEPTTAAEEEMNDTNTEADTSVDKEERQFKCEECGRSYRHSGSLLNHKKSHKTGLFRCHVCQKNFYNLLALKSHQRSHFDVKRFTCNECGKAYKIQKQLLNHQKRHKKEKLDQTPTQSKRRRPVAEVLLPVQDVPFKTNSKELPEAQSTDSPIKSEDGSDKRPYACDLCGRTYRHAGSLINHKKSHKTGEYACTVCNNSYSNQLAMKNHLRTHFALEKHFCLKCGKRLRSKKQLLVHVCSNLKRSRKGVRSKRVKAVVSSVQTKQPAAKEPRLFTCNICNRSYRHAGSLLNHKNTHKTGHYTCTFCSKHFPNLLALRNHTRIHTQKKKFVCLTCGKAFRVASLLFNHQKIHTRRSPSCNDCGASFRGRSGLQRHQCPQGPQGPQVPQQSGPSEPPADKCFKCDVCGRSYRHAGSLLNHKKTHPELLHHCSLCLQTFPDALSLHAHSQINRHCCPVCGKTFCLLPHLESHMEAHGKGHKRLLDQNGLSLHPDGSRDEERADGEDKVYACEDCGRTYRHPGSLLNHKNSHKTGSFSCAVCHKEFTNLMALKNHRRIHTEAKRYQCADCGKAFRVASRLVCHRRIHTRERPFACSVCDKSFTSKSNLRNHRSVHQVDVGGFMDLDFDEKNQRWAEAEMDPDPVCVLWVSFGCPRGVLRVCLGVLWVSSGCVWVSFGCPQGVLWVCLGVLRVCQGVLWVSSGCPQDVSGCPLGVLRVCLGVLRMCLGVLRVCLGVLRVSSGCVWVSLGCVWVSLGCPLGVSGCPQGVSGCPQGVFGCPQGVSGCPLGVSGCPLGVLFDT